MGRRGCRFGLLAGAVLAVGSLSQTARAASPVWVKITLGLGDRAGRDWSGSLQVDGGEIASLQPWGFETRHHLDAAARRWTCDSAVQVARGKTRFAEPQRGVIVGLRDADAARVSVATRQGAFAFAARDLDFGEPMRFLGGAASAERIIAPQAVADTGAEEDDPAIAVDRRGAIWIAYVSWDGEADTLLVRRRSEDGWSEPTPLAGPGDLYQVQLAADGQGRLWAVWAEQRRGNWDLYCRTLRQGRWSGERRLTTAPGSDFQHDLETDAEGRVWLAWQSLRDGQSDIYVRRLSEPDGGEVRVTRDPANDWAPDLACDGQGNVYVAWDTYRDGDYDVYARRAAPELGPLTPVAATPQFEAHASAACDRQGRLWVAYDSAQPNWGKDYSRDETLRDGNFTATLHAYRRLELRCVTPGGVCEPPQPIPQKLPASWRDVPRVVYGTLGPGRSYDLPQLSVDANGNLRLAYRVNRQGYLGHPPGGGVWEIETVWFDGRRWSAPVLVPLSRGRNAQRLEAAGDREGRWWLAWSTGSHFRGEDCDILAGWLPSPRAAAAPGPGRAAPPGGARRSGPERPVRHAWMIGGKTYHVYWGDLHRHTDISLCTPTIDGTLWDAYRYALDAARLDFMGVTDHTRDVPAYPWWRSQKMADLFTIAGRFAAFYSYERSNPMGPGGGGHRNLWFPERGNQVYYSKILDPNNPSPAGLYDMLRAERVRCAMAAHTPGWNARAGEGTWTYNDPEYEPVAEIFQAYRTAYEKPADDQDRRSADYMRSLWAALERGYRLGFIASSDHWSTHLSYACVYAEEPTRESIFQAIQARRTYAAMDKIILEFSVNGRPMGSETSASGPVDVEARVIGTAPLARVELVKNNRFIYAAEPDGAAFHLRYRDTDLRPGVAYYYLRVTQENQLPNGDPIMAWASPVWVRCRPEAESRDE